MLSGKGGCFQKKQVNLRDFRHLMNRDCMGIGKIFLLKLAAVKQLTGMTFDISVC